MSPLVIELIAPIPEGWGLCAPCEAFMAQATLRPQPVDRSMEALPPDWMDDFRRLSTVIMDLSSRYGNQILIKLIDPRSLQGIIQSFRHLVFRYPVFIIDGHYKVIGLDQNQIERMLQAAGCFSYGSIP